MKTSFWNCLGLLASLLALGGCDSKTNPPTASPAVSKSLDPLAIVLTKQTGDTKTDREIRRLQAQLRAGKSRDLTLEQLGWEFVAKARESFDAGYYKLAEQCADAMSLTNSQREAAMLLRGHVLDSLHRFHEAEIIARELVKIRGRAFDYGLLGDALMEQGRLEEAVDAYQQMMSQRPDLHAYARAAHMRWLKGDLDGAIEAMTLAVSAASPNDGESAAWANTRLANFYFQKGDMAEAARGCDAALIFQKNYAPALLLRGKMFMAATNFPGAVEVLKTTAKLNPLPEYQWALADALRGAGETNAAESVEAMLMHRGAASDPRTFALYLATRGTSPEMAVRLAREELQNRGDIFTHDALAWANFAAGNNSDARREISFALADHTPDARLFFHAAAISARCGDTSAARDFLKQGQSFAHTLLPSERAMLERLSAQLTDAFVARDTTPTISAF